ncbi:MAG: hypothetical protein HGA82_00650 [Anaerolineales bacterium]|nr:hypothetical protein [Anaerolineales bacterium]
MKPKDTAPLLWLGLVLAIALAIAFLLPVTPNDYWWYLRVGRDTLTQGTVPATDALTWSQTGTLVAYHSWGTAVLFWLVYKLGGLTLTVLLRGLLVAAAYGLTWLTARKLGAGRVGAAVVLLLAVLASSNNWSLRPQLLAYPLFALALFILYKWHSGGKLLNTKDTKQHEGKPLTILAKFFRPGQNLVYWLPLISLVWVNLHGSFVMLILLVGAALVFGRGDRRPLVLAVAGVVLATLVNPRGVGAWTYVVQSLTVPSSQLFSAEWRPPVNDNWQMNLFFLWLLAFPALAAFSPRKLSLLEWTWFLGFGFLALWGERYVIWFVFILTVLTASLLADWETKYLGDPKPGSPLLNRTLSLVFILLTLSLLPGVRDIWWPDAPEATENTPVAAVAWLAEQDQLPGPLWSEIGFSSYLEFVLPERPTWIDTRFEVFPVDQWQTYKDISEANYNWQTLLDNTGAHLLMVSTMTQPELVSALDGSSAWCEIYRDDVAVLYQPCGGDQ